MIFTILSVLILLYGFINFKKGFMLFLVYQIFWYSTLIMNVGSLSLSTSILLTTGYSFLYLIQSCRLKKCKAPFPFAAPFKMVIFSYILTCFFALSGFGPEFARSINYILKDYIIIWIAWNVIETKEDFKYLFKLITVVILICCIYGLVEYITSNNPILDYKVVLSSDTIVVYDSSGLRGYRLVSLFEHPIGAGMTLGLYATFVICLWMRGDYFPNRKIALITAVLCLPCVVLTKMRSAILFTLICMFSFVNFKALKRRKFVYLFLATIVCLPLFAFILRDNLGLFLNMFSADTSSIGGSSLSMRITQLNAIFEIFKDSPIAGLGETFRSYITRSAYTDAALGYEGLWTEKLVMHGIVGIISTVIMIYYTVIKVPLRYKSREARIFAISYWAVYTFSSIPSFRTPIFYLAEFYFIKASNVYQSCDASKRNGGKSIQIHLRG